MVKFGVPVVAQRKGIQLVSVNDKDLPGIPVLVQGALEGTGRIRGEEKN